MSLSSSASSSAFASQFPTSSMVLTLVYVQPLALKSDSLTDVLRKILNGFQSMQGFLRVFGVPSKTTPGAYAIEVNFYVLPQFFSPY